MRLFGSCNSALCRRDISMINCRKGSPSSSSTNWSLSRSTGTARPRSTSIHHRSMGSRGSGSQNVVGSPSRICSASCGLDPTRLIPGRTQWSKTSSLSVLRIGSPNTSNCMVLSMVPMRGSSVLMIIGRLSVRSSRTLYTVRSRRVRTDPASSICARWAGMVHCRQCCARSTTTSSPLIW